MGHGLTADELLKVWEQGLTALPVQRALDLLAASEPGASREQLLQLPIGQRDTRLMEIREALFGPRLACLIICPKCNQQLEISLDLAQLRSSPDEPAEGDDGAHLLKTGGCVVRFRLPNSADMLLIADLTEPDQARNLLFERCVQQATRDGVTIAASEVPEAVVTGVANRMALIDPQADIQIAMSCPACGQRWSSAFDIVSYLWSEINAWAIRILREVHQLARAYGWREADILALSPMRRKFYLELIG